MRTVGYIGRSCVAAAVIWLAPSPWCAAASYAPGDTWVLEGATDWTNAPTFVGLGSIADLGSGADTNKVWSFKKCTDVYSQTGTLNPFTSPALLTTYTNDLATGPYRTIISAPNQEAWISPTIMHITAPNYGARVMPAVIWESPIQGTVRMTGTLSYTGGVGAVAYGVFLEDVSTGKFYQLTNGILPTVGPFYSNTLDVAVSLDAGDRLYLVNRTYTPVDGDEYLYTSGPASYLRRWAYHRNLTVTYQSSAMTQGPVLPSSWRRADVWWRADVYGGASGTAVQRIAYDRRDPSLPARYYAYVSDNTNMDMAAGTAGLTNGETLKLAANVSGGVGNGGSGVSREVLWCRVVEGARDKPPVWLFRPPAAGFYQLSGVLTNLASNIGGGTRVWIGTATVSGWGASNPVLSNVSRLWDGLGNMGLSTNLLFRASLGSTNSTIYMTLTGWEASGTRTCMVMDRDLVIERIPSGTVVSVK